MAKNRNHYFKVKPGDDARLFNDVDIETEGFIARLRRTAHDCEPYGFLVDGRRRRPYDAKKIADIVHLGNQRTTVVLGEAHLARLIETAAQFRFDLVSAAGKNKKAKLRLEVFDEMCRDLPENVSLVSVFVMPSLVDDYIDSEAGKRFGKDGGNPELLHFRRQREQASNPLTPPHNSDGTTPDVMSQKSESEIKDQSQSSSSARERELPPRAREDGSIGKPMPWSVYTARAHEIALWQKRQSPMSEEPFDLAFDAEFQMGPWSVWCQIKRDMESSIPAPCHDGHHVFEGDYCRYCPFIRVGEETA